MTKGRDYVQVGIRVPTVHLNGTSGRDLAEQVKEAGSAVYAAIEALQAAAPNARDYYPQGDEAYREAREQHEDRLARLDSVYAELGAIYEGLV